MCGTWGLELLLRAMADGAGHAAISRLDGSGEVTHELVELQHVESSLAEAPRWALFD